jgi:hypothetical protein
VGAAGPAEAPLLSVQGLCVDFVSEEGPVRAVDRVSFEVGRGELLRLAGESGSGKSTVAQALLRLLPSPAVITGGRVLFEGRDLTALDETGLRQVRWRRLSLVFQGALDALNPVLTVGAQLADTLRADGQRGARVKERSIELLGWSGSGRSTWPATRTSSPAACASGSASRWRWRSSRRWWCSTSRPPPSTCWWSRRSSGSCRRCGPGWASRPSSSPMT